MTIAWMEKMPVNIHKRCCEALVTPLAALVTGM